MIPPDTCTFCDFGRLLDDVAMEYFTYADSPYAIRGDLKREHRRFWQTLASPGSWWTGEERIAIAQEVRNATRCRFCAERKRALSPYAVQGQHDHSDHLGEVAVDAIHRIITDQTRITQGYIDEIESEGLSNEACVELAGVALAVFSIDEFRRALGLTWEALPDPTPGEPNHYRPDLATTGTGFVPMLPPDGAVGKESDLWPQGGAANVLRALSLVPQAVRDWIRLASAQYLSVTGMANLVKQEDRAIDRMQMELVAGRVSSINECFY